MVTLPRHRILLTGATGQVGGQIAALLSDSCELIAPSRSELDLSQPETVRQIIRSTRPRWIINPGAYTAVDKAESDRDTAFKINEESVAVIGQEAKAIGAAVIHFSTDYVFSGLGVTPYLETDVPAPVSVYGASKLAGEQALASSGAAHFTFRTSWVYGATGKNFLLTILKVAQERDSLRIVADQHGAPTWSRDLALLTAAVIEKTEMKAASNHCSIAEAATTLGGLYHAAGAGETTWHGFAAAALRLLHEQNPALKLATLEGITTADYPTPATRPQNSRLDCGKLAHVLDWRMPAWQTSLHSVMAEVFASQPVVS
jgi:dTDP-4-dehydrorhamnose reductase